MPVVPDCQESWEAVRIALSAGQLAVVPTDTVYGLICDPFNVRAIENVYEVKGRPANKALPLLISGPDILRIVAIDVPDTAYMLAQQFWPGALTLVVGRASILPEALTGSDTVAVRVPDHLSLRAFLASYSGFVAGTSANISGQPDALTAEEAYHYFGEKVALVLDGGRSSVGTPSTVVDCTRQQLHVLREGGISEQVLREVVSNLGNGS